MSASSELEESLRNIGKAFSAAIVPMQDFAQALISTIQAMDPNTKIGWEAWEWVLDEQRDSREAQHGDGSSAIANAGQMSKHSRP